MPDWYLDRTSNMQQQSYGSNGTFYYYGSHILEGLGSAVPEVFSYGIDHFRMEILRF